MNRQRGLSLLEVLVAMLLFSVGLLGVVSLQVSQLRQVRLADQHSRAALAVSALAARMQVNPAGAQGGAYALACTATAPAAAHDCRLGPCAPPQLAAWELAGAITALQPAAIDPTSALDAADVEPLPQAYWAIDCIDDCARARHRITLCWATATDAAPGCDRAPGRACVHGLVTP